MNIETGHPGLARRAADAVRLALITWIVATACGFQSGTTAAASAQPATQPGWKCRPDPIIQMGDYRDKALWNDPCVLHDGAQYVIYMTTSTGEPFKPPILPFRAVSSDGLKWNIDPPTPLLDTRGTPYVSIETPSVVKYHDTYHLYYSGIFPEGKVPTMAIGHATSKDGIAWTKDAARTAVLSATGKVTDWNGYLVGEPGAVVYNDRIYLYFTAMGARSGGTPPQIQVIGLATSTDGSRFDAPRVVLRQSALYPPEKGYVGYSTPAAAVSEGKVHLFFDVAYFNQADDPQWAQVALHHAVSSDGTIFQQDHAPILTRDSLDWAAGEILAPCALVENGTVKLWFAGHDKTRAMATELLSKGKGRKFGIGYASISVTSLEANNR